MCLLGADKSHNKVVRMAILNTRRSEYTRLCVCEATRVQAESVFAYFQMQNKKQQCWSKCATQNAVVFVALIAQLPAALFSWAGVNYSILERC